MSPHPDDPDPKTCNGRQEGSSPARHGTEWQNRWVHMEGIRGIGPPTSGIDDAGLDHVSGAVKSFFARLEHTHDGSGQRVSPVGEQVSRSHEHGGMQVVSAGMHPWRIDRERQSGLFSQWESVHVRSQQDYGTMVGTSGLAPQNGHHSRCVFVLADLYGQGGECAQDYRFGLGQMETELGHSMQAAPKCHEVGLELTR